VFLLFVIFCFLSFPIRKQIEGEDKGKQRTPYLALFVPGLRRSRVARSFQPKSECRPQEVNGEVMCLLGMPLDISRFHNLVYQKMSNFPFLSIRAKINLSNMLRSRCSRADISDRLGGIGPLLKIVHVVAHCDEQIEEHLATHLHLHLHRSAVLERLAAANNQS